MRGAAFIVICAALASCSPRVSGEIATACMEGGRSAANAALCSCVQQAANQTLNGSDQATAATFFEDPQKAQDMKASRTSRADAFWDRYQNFTSTARAMCRR